MTTRGINKPLKKKWNSKEQLEAQIRLLARIIEKEKQQSRRVVLKDPLDEVLTKAVKTHIEDPARIHQRERVYISVIARTEVITLTNDDTPPNSSIRRVETCYSVPDAFPVTIQHKGNNFMTDASGPALKRKFLELQIGDYRNCRQILSIIPPDREGGHPEIDHLASAAAAGIMRGIHYDTQLQTAEAEQLLRITFGALVRTPQTEEKIDWEWELTLPYHLQQERFVELLHGERCKFVLGTKGKNGMTAVCGAPFSLEHILSHIPDDDLLAASMKVSNGSKVGPMKEFREYPKYMAFGFLPTDLYKHQPPEKQKELKKQLRLTAATFSRVGLTYYKMCAGKEAPPLHDFVVDRGEDIQKRFKYIAKADASMPLPKEGEDAKGPTKIGLGGYIALVSDPTRILWKFQVCRLIPWRSIGIGEHLSNMVLSKMIVCTIRENVCIGSDNQSVPQQHESEFKVGNPAVRVIRAKTATIKMQIEKYQDAWFPREQNAIADDLAKRALEQELGEKEWVKELDETLADLYQGNWLIGS